jgi:hypothetical protein
MTLAKASGEHRARHETVNKRQLLVHLTQWSMALLVLLGLYVVLDYTVDFRPATIQSSYHFSLHDIPVDQPVWLSQDNLTILLIRRSNRLRVELLEAKLNLQDPESQSSRQPEYAKNRLRSRSEEYFVSYALGSDLGCPLEAVNEQSLRESCGSASYDYAGRAINGQNRFQNLAIPDYNFNHDFSALTVNP